MAIDLVTLALAKKFTKQTAQGGGAVAGKPCQIDSIEAIPGGHRVTFLWELNDGTTQTGQMDVMDGEDGSDIASITQDGKVITIELSDGTSHEFTIPTVKGDKGEKGDKGDTGTDGKGIKAVTIDENEHLIITYTDDTTMDAGKIEVQSAVQSVNGMTGDVELDASDVGALPDDTVIPSKTSELTNDNGFQTASDVSAAISGKVDKVAGKGLSANDYSNADKAIVDGVATALAGKADKTDVIDGASYDSTNHRILFKKGTTTLFSLDAAAFVKDGMVDAVSITGGNLVITFNTDAGKQAISIPISDIFDADNYYDKDATDDLLDDKTDKVSGAVNGNFAGLDANGNLTDSGKKAADFATPAEVSTQGSAQETLIRGTVGWTGKNLIKKSRKTTVTNNGVTFVFNADGSVTFSGTTPSDANAEVVFDSVDTSLDEMRRISDIGTDLILSGSDSADSIYCVEAIYRTSESVYISDERAYSGDLKLTVPTNAYYLRVAVMVKAGNTISTPTTVYPMVRRADIKDDTYEPYHESVETMYEEEVHGVNLNKGDASHTYIRGEGASAPYRTYNCPLAIPFAVGDKFIVSFDIADSANFDVSTAGAAMRFWGNNGVSASEDWIVGNANGHYEHTFLITQAGSYVHDLYLYLQQTETNPNAALTVKNLMIRKAAIEDSTYRPYNHQAIQNQINAQGVLGAKNRLKFPYHHVSGTPIPVGGSVTNAGITYTVNEDGSITAGGTATAGSYCIFNRKQDWSDFDLYGKRVKLSVKPVSNSVYIQLYDTDNSKTLFRTDATTGEVEFIFPASLKNNTSWNISIDFPTGAEPNNTTYYPILRLASDPDDTYAPYAMTNKELTEKVTSNALDIQLSTENAALLQNKSKIKGDIVNVRIQLQVTAEIEKDAEIMRADGTPHSGFGVAVLGDTNSGNLKEVVVLSSSSNLIFTAKSNIPIGYYALNYTYVQ